MTDDEKRRCKSDTLEELAEMRAQRRCFVTKTEKMQKQLESAQTVLRSVLATEPGKGVPVEGRTPDERDWPTYADIAALHEDMWNTCKRIHILNGRLREWGVID